MTHLDEHQKAQQREFDVLYGATRSYWFSSDSMTQYIVFWRLKASLERLQARAGDRLSNDSSILFLCAGDGAEASACRSMFGFGNVSFSDVSSVAVEAGLKRDPALKGIVADAESTGLADGSYDVVIVQDGLHHLQSPVRGFTEMLRIARVGAVFIEPHDALIGSLIGTKWERHGSAVNFVFRWDNGLVEQVASSYLGPDSFENLSFSYWHHNPAYARLGSLVGKGRKGMHLVRAVKGLLDTTLPGCGNMFSGIILKNR